MSERSRERTAAAALFGFALVLRLVALFEAREIPSVEMLIIDARSYDEWARRIAAGDWIGDTVFYQAPLYPYLMAAVYALPGPDVVMLRLLQATLGAASCALLFAATRRLFGVRAGVAAGLLLALYAPAIFFDGIVQKTSLGLFLTASALFLLVSFQARPRLRVVGTAGLVLGFLALTRENALILIPVIGFWLVLRFRELPWSRRLGFVAVFSVGVLAPLLGVATRNQIVGDTFALTTSQLGTNFYYGNNPDADGGYVPLLPGRHTPQFEAPDARRLAERALGRELSAGEVSGYWLGRGLDFVRDEPGAWFLLTLRKALFVLNDFEMPDTEDIYVYADWSRVLGMLHPVFGFGMFLPLAIAGVALAFRTREGRRDGWLLVALALTYAAGVTLFLVLARFRLPLVPLLLPFAGLALARMVDAIRRRALRPPAIPLVAFLCAALLANWPLHDRDRLRATSYVNYGAIESDRGDYDAAERYLRLARELAPDSGEVGFHLGVILHRQGRFDEAEQVLREQLRRWPTDYRAHLGLADLFDEKGETQRATYHRRMARRLFPGP